jgi:hypothetical protein
MKAHIPISIYEWVESYGLTQYILFITNKSNQKLLNFQLKTISQNVACQFIPISLKEAEL